MTDQSAQEPTMEEILASIRRIISEDDAPAETPAAAAPEATPEPVPEPLAAETIFAAPVEPTPEPAAVEDDVLELTDRYEAPAETIGDLDVVEHTPEPYQPEPEPAPLYAESAPESAPSYDTLVGDSAAASAASAFAGLAASFQKPAAAPAPSGPDLTFASGSTVEAMVAEMLRPLLKDWLDANLPGIVEEQVRKEVERIARSAG
jgi:cell pole-organizing protein PopZ